jgi:hypothetical protein
MGGYMYFLSIFIGVIALILIVGKLRVMADRSRFLREHYARLPEFEEYDPAKDRFYCLYLTGGICKSGMMPVKGEANNKRQERKDIEQTDDQYKRYDSPAYIRNGLAVSFEQ